MPRTARRISKTKIYHIMIRGINQKNIFADDEDHVKSFLLLIPIVKRLSMKYMPIA